MSSTVTSDCVELGISVDTVIESTAFFNFMLLPGDIEVEFENDTATIVLMDNDSKSCIDVDIQMQLLLHLFMFVP